MFCYQAEEKIQEYLEELLSPSEEANLAKHLLKCADCRRFLDEMQWLHELALQQPIQIPTSDLAQEVMRQIQRRPERVPTSRRFPFSPAYALLLWVLGYLGWLGWDHLVGWHRLTGRLGPWVEVWRHLDRQFEFIQGWLSHWTVVRMPWFWPLVFTLALLAAFWDRRVVSRDSGD